MKKILLLYKKDRLVAIDEDWESYSFEDQWKILKAQDSLGRDWQLQTVKKEGMA